MLTGCGRKPELSATRWELFSEGLGTHWKEAEIAESGGITKHEDGYTLKEGGPITGIVFPQWSAEKLPLNNYRIEYDVMRIHGADFFGTVTFPVHKIDQWVSFVFGGWGGFQVGISSVDGQDASVNTTGSSQPLENGKWYHIRIEVRDDLLEVWMNDRPLVRLVTTGRLLHLRTGDMDKCTPFGFASYGTEAQIKNCVISTLNQ